MKKRAILAIAALFALGACSKKEEKKSDTPAPVKPAAMKKGPAKVAPKKVEKKVAPKVVVKKLEEGFKKIPNIKGFIAKVPAHAIANGLGGAAGFHSKDESFDLILREVKGDELKKDFKSAVKDAKAILFKKMVKKEKTKDGWVLIWNMENMNDKTKKASPVMFSFEVRRVIEGKTYKCYGGILKEKGIADCVAACQSIKKG